MMEQKYSNSCYETVDEKCVGSSKIQTDVYATASASDSLLVTLQLTLNVCIYNALWIINTVNVLICIFMDSIIIEHDAIK